MPEASRQDARQARLEARSRAPELLAQILRDLAASRAPWLLDGSAAPKQAHPILRDLRRELSREARTGIEAVHLSEALHREVDVWNAAHPGAEVAAPGAVTVIGTVAPAWTPDSLERLRVAGRLRRAFDDRIELAALGRLPAEGLAGLVLASAVFDSACLGHRDLAVFARWLADPEGPVHVAEGLAWVDLKHRAPVARGRARPQPLRTISGTDEAGPYALRRLFLSGRTLDMIIWHDNSGGAGRALGKAAADPAALMRLIGCALSAEGEALPALHLRRFLEGATFLREADPDGPCHALAGLASRRLQTYAATPESWAVALGVAPRAAAPANPAFDPGPLFADIEEEVEAAGRPLPETDLFFRFHAAIHPPKRQHDDLTTDDVKLTRAQLAGRLRGLGIGPDWPEALRLLADWYLHLLEDGLLPTSVQRYASTLSAAFAAGAGAEPLRGLAAEDFEDLYDEILSAETRGALEHRNLRNRLRALHHFAVADPRWDFPVLADGIFAGDGAVTHVRAELLGRPESDAARDIIRSRLGLAPEVARAADAAFLFMSRCGTRIGETTKALLSHLEDVPAPAGGWEGRDRPHRFLVRPSRFGDNKTLAAGRQIPPFALMTAAETADFEAYLADRRRRDPRGPLFGVERPDGRVAPFSRVALGAICAEALRRASGLTTVSSHSLRRAALTSAFLAIHEARAGSGAGARVLRRLTGWDRATRARVAETLAPATLCRDGWTALARFAGHASAATTFSTYVAAADLAILDACARPPRPGEDDLPFVPRPRAVRLEPQGRSLTARRAAIGGRAAATPAALLSALDLVDEGHAPAAAASAARLPTRFLTDRLEIARAWSALTTRRGELRLQPLERAGLLAPDPLRGARRAEALDLADRLVARAADHPEPVERWIRAALHDATQTNAGQRLTRPAALGAWLGTALALRPAERWQAEAVLPPGLEDLPAAWADLLPANLPLTRRPSAAGASVVLRLRLRAPEPPAGGNGTPASSWAGSLRHAAHLAAIFLRSRV